MKWALSLVADDLKNAECKISRKRAIKNFLSARNFFFMVGGAGVRPWSEGCPVHEGLCTRLTGGFGGDLLSTKYTKAVTLI